MLPDIKDDVKIIPPRQVAVYIFRKVQKASPIKPLLETHATGTFHRPFFYHYQVEQNETAETKPNEINFNIWLQLFAAFEQPISVEQAIYVRFYNVKQVHSIYVQNLREVYNVFIFLEQDHYDDELMDQLLDKEGEILDLYHNNLFHFQYLPLLKDCRPSQFIPKNAVLIFSR